MAFLLSQAAQDALRSTESVKLVATIGKDGTPHVTEKGTLTLRDDGRIAFYEFIETSQTNKNLVFSIWFSKVVAITALTKYGKSFLIKGKPYKTVIAGQEFLSAYADAQQRFGKDTDLSAVWLIDPEWEREETFSVRRNEEETAHPYELHIDRIIKEEYKS
jgi:hypothetical protein